MLVYMMRLKCNDLIAFAAIWAVDLQRTQHVADI